MGKLAKQSKAQSYSKILVVNVAAIWDEDYYSYPGRSCIVKDRLLSKFNLIAFSEY